MKINKLFTMFVIFFLVLENVVNLKADEEISDNYKVVIFDGLVEYTSLYNGKTSFDSNFGKDAAFLYEEDGNVYFKVSGDIGYIEAFKVEVKSIEEIKENVSAYFVKDGILYHNIKTNFNNNFYTYSLPLDDAPDYLKEGNKYYSYDGKYFYSKYSDMIDDYLEEDSMKAINYENPYYNYYEFLPLRSYTNITLEDLKTYLYDELKIKGKLNSYSDLSKDGANDVVNRSQYYEELESFFAYEEIYGTNAIRLLVESINESSYGKSYDSYTKNNVYSSAAYDSNKERELERFDNIDTSIYSHAKYYLSRAFGNNKYDYYKGSSLGNKVTGSGFSYSSDLYGGEKVVSNYYIIDSYFGLKDKNAYSIGIIENVNNLNIYDEDLNVEYKLNNIKDFSVILLSENEDYYKIQLDPSLNSDYTYDPEECVAYILKDEVDLIIGSKDIKEKEYKEVHYDFGEGTLHYTNDITIKVPKDKNPVMVLPKLDGYEALGFIETDNSNSFKTKYEKIKKVEIYNKAKEKSEYGEAFNITGGSIKVTYGGLNSKIIEYNTNIVKDTEDNRFEIEYNGFNLTQNINLSYDLISSKEIISEIIERNIDSYKENGTYNIDELKKVKEDIKELGYELSFDEIRLLDEIFLNDSRSNVNYSFEKFDHDISVSGLSLALREPGLLKIFKPFKDTYFTRVGNVSSSNEKISNGVAKAYGLNEVTSLKLSIQFNLRTADLESPVVVSIKIDDKKDSSIYTVYHVDQYGDVIKCLTSQSDDYIQFLCKESGDYFVYQKDGFNDYDFDNYYENINIYNADADNHLLFINGSLLFAIGVFGAAIIVVHIILNKKQEKIWRDYKKYWQPAVSPQEEKLKN